MYREFSILFIRILAIRQGFVMGAMRGGKLKAWAYAFAGISGLLYISIVRTGIAVEYADPVLCVAKIFFVIAAVAAVISLASYIVMLKKKFFKK
jgi:phosphatidylglycerophosphate synthase